MSDIPVKPTGYRVLIRADKVTQSVDKEKFETLAAAGFEQSAEDAARKQSGQIWGTLVGKGPKAFSDPDLWGESERDDYEEGVKVFYKRYTGQNFETVDQVEGGPTYILMIDSDVLGIVNTNKEMRMVADHE